MFSFPFTKSHRFLLSTSSFHHLPLLHILDHRALFLADGFYGYICYAQYLPKFFLDVVLLYTKCRNLRIHTPALSPSFSFLNPLRSNCCRVMVLCSSVSSNSYLTEL